MKASTKSKRIFLPENHDTGDHQHNYDDDGADDDHGHAVKRLFEAAERVDRDRVIARLQLIEDDVSRVRVAVLEVIEPRRPRGRRHVEDGRAAAIAVPRLVCFESPFEREQKVLVGEDRRRRFAVSWHDDALQRRKKFRDYATCCYQGTRRNLCNEVTRSVGFPFIASFIAKKDSPRKLACLSASESTKPPQSKRITKRVWTSPLLTTAKAHFFVKVFLLVSHG